MIVKSPKKKYGNMNIKLPNKDRNSDILLKRDIISITKASYLMNSFHGSTTYIEYVCSRIARNTEIFS